MLKVLSILPRERFDEAGVVLPENVRFVFKSVSSEDDIIRECRGMDFLIVPPAFPPVTARVMENIPSIRMIQSTGAGYDNIDIDSAEKHHLPVTHSPGLNTTSVAEFAIASIIVLQRNMILSDREIKAGNYTALRERLFRSGLNEVADIQLGIIGMGAIGRETAKLAQFLNARIGYYDLIRQKKDLETALHLTYQPLDNLLAASDVISLHVPLSEKTRAMIGYPELKRMPSGALLINTARGEIIDQSALADVLESGHLGGAAVDMISPEPPPPDHPLLNLSPQAGERLLVTPHIAGITRGALKRMLNASLSNISRAAEGLSPKSVVNNVSGIREPA